MVQSLEIYKDWVDRYSAPFCRTIYFRGIGQSVFANNNTHVTPKMVYFRTELSLEVHRYER